MNCVNLIGHVTNDIETRYTPQGNPVATFGIAVNRRYRQGDEMKQEATFVDLVAFNRTAEIAQEYLGKGRPVGIQGRLRYRSWESDGGQRRSKLEVVVNQLHLMPRNNGKNDGSESTEEFDGTIPDEIPF